MPFRELQRYHATLQETVVRLSVGKTITIVIGESIARDAGLQLGGKAAFLLGEGEDAGKLRLMPAEQGYAISKAGQRTHRLKVARGPWPGCPALQSGPVPHQCLEGGGIEILLPVVTRAAEKRAPAAPVPAPRPAAAPAPINPDADPRLDALVQAITELYRQNTHPGYSDLARLTGIPQGTIGLLLNMLARDGRVTRDADGVRPRGAAPLKVRA